jgi:NAD+ diphosphatase
MTAKTKTKTGTVQMHHAESVTFGGSQLDRAAALRGDTAQMDDLLSRGQVLPVWRGKPLTDGAGLAWVAPDHPVLARGTTRVFLGLDGDVPRFAQDIGLWQPDADTTSVGSFVDPSIQHHPDLPATAGFAELRGLMTVLPPRAAELAATARALLQWHAVHGFCAACGVRSDIAMAGWQRDCPACNTHHFPRTDPVVIMLVTHGNRTLMGRSPGWPEGMYSCLAGFVEPGETIEAAVRREVAEESGVRIGAVRYLASQPWPFPASLMIGCAAEATTDAITIDPAELEDALWISREEMITVMAGEHPRLKPARKGAIAHFLIANWLADRLG